MRSGAGLSGVPSSTSYVTLGQVLSSGRFPHHTESVRTQRKDAHRGLGVASSTGGTPKH